MELVFISSRFHLLKDRPIKLLKMITSLARWKISLWTESIIYLSPNEQDLLCSWKLLYLLICSSTVTSVNQLLSICLLFCLEVQNLLHNRWSCEKKPQIEVAWLLIPLDLGSSYINRFIFLYHPRPCLLLSRTEMKHLRVCQVWYSFLYH